MIRNSNPATLASVILDAVREHPDRISIRTPAEQITYRDFVSAASRIAREIGVREHPSAPSFVAVCAGDSAAAFIGHAAALISGHGFLPVSPSAPPRRAMDGIERSGCHVILHDAAGARIARNLESPPGITIRTIDVDALRSSPPTEPVTPEMPPAPADHAYLLFTSGSTGRPKGVPIRHESILAFLQHVGRRYELGPDDRISHLFPTTFDLSIFDQFAAWQSGACVCIPEPMESLEAYAARHRITSMFCVPSRVRLARQAGQLEPGSLPTLRWALFCGEALREREAMAMARAAPNAIVENLYGPTEATLSCLVHRYAPDPHREAAAVVPIGVAHEGHRARIINPETGRPSATGSGELLLAGPQVFEGYWGDAERTRDAFLTGDDGTRHYRTGDLVRRNADGTTIEFLGRLDSQIKILGHRVELGDIDAALMSITEADAAATVPVLNEDGEIDLLVGFVCRARRTEDLRDRLVTVLPRYMLPAHVEFVDELPTNASGKIDRNALRSVAATLV